MNRNAISLVGIVDTLKHVVESDPAAQKNKELRGAAKRLECVRRELLTEGLRYSKVVGAARDYISEVSAQLCGHVTEKRDLQWVLHGLQCAHHCEVDPPVPPGSSSSSGDPGGEAPEVTQLARLLFKIASAPSIAEAMDAAPSRFAGPRQTVRKVTR
jgi:hypothetical protein